MFDFVFVHTRRSIPILQSLGVERVGELIWPCFPAFRPVVDDAKSIEVLFLGTPSPHRERILARIGCRYNLVSRHDVFHQKARAAMSRAKIVLNVHFTPLRNFECRVTEVLGCGAFLLTEALEPDDVFIDGEHLAVFDESNVEALIDRYLCDDERRQRIAEAGHRAAWKYSVDNQIQQILQVVNESRASRSAEGSVNPPSVHVSQSSHAIQERESSFASVKSASVTISGQSFTLRVPDEPRWLASLNAIFRQGTYPIIPFPSAEEGAIIDIESGIGAASLLFGALYPRKTVFAFSVGGPESELLSENVAQVANVRIRSIVNGNPSVTFSAENSPAKSRSSRLVSSLLPFLQDEGLHGISLLRIDSEGNEIPILQCVTNRFDQIDCIFVETYSEASRLKLDGILSERFLLAQATAPTFDRGTWCYVAKEKWALWKSKSTADSTR